MASLSVLTYNLTQGLKMKSNENSTGSSSLANSNSSNNSLAKTFNKITVQNVLSESKGNVLNISNNNGNLNSSSSSINNANAIVKKIKDFGMIGTVNAVNNSSHTSSMTVTKVAVARKRPLSESKVSNNSLIKPAATAATPKKPKLSTKAATTPKTSAKKSCENISQQKLLTQVSTTTSSNNAAASTIATTPILTAGTPGRKGLPAPQAVARRNARERNRVKQVNNGFAALRERIPEEVAEAFEAQGNSRAAAASKKLSKVETLRMAVEYIRSLERLLGFDFPIGATPTGDDSFALIKDEFGALSPGLDDQYNDDSLSNYELDEDFAASHSQIANNSDVSGTHFDEQPLNNANVLELLPNITTLNGLQYIRIPGTSTYQLLTADMFAGNSQSPTTSNNIEDEQFNALIDTNCQSPRSATSSVTTTTADDLHGSPTANVATTTLIMQTTAAPALHQAAATNGVHVRRTTSSSSSLSRSPVPQTSSSPNAATSLLHQQRQELPTTTTEMLSPVGNDELLLQTCADDVVLNMANNERLSVAGHQQFVAPRLAHQQQQQQQQSVLPSHKIKQEFNETDFNATHTELSPNLSTALIYQTIMQHNQQQRNQQQQQQQQQQQLLLEQTSMSMSPPLDRISNPNSTEVILTTSSALPGYFEQDQNGSFYDGIVTFKKEHNDHSMLDTTSNNTTTVLSDESMMEAIDWWEAHTPKSDGGSVIM